MNVLKERNLGHAAMDDVSWSFIKETPPDEWDQDMLREAALDPECHMFLSSEEAMKELDL